MRTTVNESGVLGRLAGGWLRQIRAIGQLAVGAPWTDEGCWQDLIAQVAIRRSLLKVLEMAVQLRYTDEEVSYCHALEEWPLEAGPGGYCNASTLPPSAHVTSMFMAWNAAKTKTSIAHRLTRAGAWVKMHSGFDAALHYLIDLIRDGHVVAPGDCSWAMARLISGVAAEGRGQALTEFLFGKRELSAKEWCQSSVVCEDFDLDDSNLATIGRRASELLVSKLLALAEEARDAMSWDEWLARVCSFRKAYEAVMPFAGRFLSSNLQWNAVLIQLEEFAADAGGLIVVSMTPGMSAPLWQCFSNVRVFAAIIEGRDPEGWPDRIVHERLLLPRALRACLVSKPTFVDLSSIEGQSSWQQISLDLYPAVCLSLLKRPIMPLQRNKPELEPAAGDDEGDGDPVELFQRRLTAGIEATEANPGEGVRLLRKACEIYPWTGWAHAELGIAQDTSGDPASALLQLEKAILSMPDQHLWWQSLGVVLRRLGHDTEARIAQVISQWIAEEKAKRGEQ